MAKDKKRKHDEAAAEAVPATEPATVPETAEKQALSNKAYAKELKKLHVELVKLQQWVVHKGLKVCILFEGRDGAGKGGTIKAITERESPALNRSLLCCHGRGDTESVSVVLRGNSPYIQTGIFAAEACRKILLGTHRGKGFMSPAGAFGAREMIAAIAASGQLAWDTRTV